MPISLFSEVAEAERLFEILIAQVLRTKRQAGDSTAHYWMLGRKESFLRKQSAP